MLTADDYYIIEAKAAEWVYVLDKLIHEAKDTLTTGDAIVSLELTHPVYYLSRKKFTATALARVLGGSEAQITNSKVIRLEPYKRNSNLPNPSVPYFGEA